MSRATVTRVLVCAVGVLLAGFCAAAQAAAPALGRWSGSGAGGKVQFVVSRVGRTLVASDVVVSCPGAAGAADDDGGGADDAGGDFLSRGEDAIGSNGVIYYDGREAHPRSTNPGLPLEYLSGRLSGSHGTVSTSGSIAWDGSGTCPASGFRDIHVTHTGGTELRDGLYKLTGPAGTSGNFWVYGDGALIEYYADFGTPVGGDEDDPELCAEDDESADFGLGSPTYPPILPSPSGSFTLDNTAAIPGGLETVTSSGSFNGSRAVGTYTAGWDYEDEIACTGIGAFALTLSVPAPPLIPDAAPRGVTSPRSATHPGRHRGAPTDKRTPAPGRHRKERRITYVALGDSYAAGVGVTPYLPGAGGIAFSCLRSTRAYSRQLQLPGVGLDREFYACSGATTANLTRKGGKRGEPPQLKHPSLRKAKLVTVQFGGDDAGFLPVLIRCARLAQPLACTGPGAKRILSRVSKLEPTLVRSFRVTRHATARGAVIAALDYPLLFPQKPADYCSKLLTWYSPSAIRLLNRAGNLLDDEIEAAAHTVGIQFVDVRHAFLGHEVCAKHEWINFLTKGPGLGFGNGTLHPNWAGQRAYARVLGRKLAHEL